MATVKYNGVTYECVKAIRGEDYLHLVDADGNLIAAFDGVADFSGFELSDCTFAEPKDCDDCPIVVMGEDGALRPSNKTPRAASTSVVEQNVFKDLYFWVGTAEEYSEQKEHLGDNVLCLIKDDPNVPKLNEAYTSGVNSEQRVVLYDGAGTNGVDGDVSALDEFDRVVAYADGLRINFSTMEYNGSYQICRAYIPADAYFITYTLTYGGTPNLWRIARNVTNKDTGETSDEYVSITKIIGYKAYSKEGE